MGHTAGEMVSWINNFMQEESEDILCRQFIISGGIRDFLDGYYWMNKIRSTICLWTGQWFPQICSRKPGGPGCNISVSQIRGLQLAHTFLKVK